MNRKVQGAWGTVDGGHLAGILPAVLETVADAIVSVDPDLRITLFNAGAERLFGYNANEVLGESVDTLMVAAFADLVRDCMGGMAETVTSEERVEFAGQRGNGEAFQAEGSVIRTQSGGVLAVTAIMRESTRPEGAEVTPRRVAGNLEEIERIGHIGNWSRNGETGELYWSDEVFRIFGRTPGEFSLTEERFVEMIHPDDREALRLSAEKALSEGCPHSIDHRIILPNGTVRWVHEEAIPTTELNGVPYAFVGTVQDITDRKLEEQALAGGHEQLRQVIDNLPVWVAYIGADLRYRFVNQTCATWLARTPEDIVGTYVSSILNIEFERLRPMIDRALAGERVSFRMELAYPDGVLRAVRIEYIPQLNASGKLDGYVTMIEDLSDLRRTEMMLEQQERFLDSIVENIPIMVFVKEAADLGFVRLNKAGEELLGFSRDELMGKSDTDFFPPEQASFFIGKDRDVLASREMLDIPVEQIETKEHGTRILHTRKIGLYDETGQPTHLLGISEDITQQVEAEERLRQSQKMEAIGQLTGGVAHDVNNMLGVILGNAEQAELMLGDNAKARDYVERVIDAVNKSASLTGRLLSFGRQQTLRPEATDVCELVRGLEEMLRRTLGEMVRLRVACRDDEWPATVDAHQFENALLNLALNARDAMPGGGELTIFTENALLDSAYTEQYDELVPGDYVKVSVRDDGLGIEPSNLQKVFEPFFTTKGVGEGSGLGLSMVYGFAKQSNGHVTIESEMGQGTVVSLFLPRAPEEAKRQPAKIEEGAAMPGRGLRVLVVEDEEDLREISVRMLSNAGFEVSQAGNGAEAFALLRDVTFDVLFSDVVLPGGIGGVAIAEEAQRLQPKIVVLLGSGYAQIDQTEKGLESGFRVLPKPFRRAELLSEVARLLDQRDEKPRDDGDGDGDDRPRPRRRPRRDAD